jgi:ribosomal protein S18 acetylase RimI-like enzyme
MDLQPAQDTPISSWTSRLYETRHDFQQMQDLLIAARSRSDDWHYCHVGDLIWEFFMVNCHLNPQEHVRFWHNAEGLLIGYAILGEDPSFDWQVLPEYEWLGIEIDAVMWAESCMVELRKYDEQRWSGPFVSSARQDNARRIAFLEQHGFQRGEYAEVNMLCSLMEPMPQPVAHTGFQVRAVAKIGEIFSRALAEREVWDPWPVSKISGEDYANLMQLPGYYRDLDIVAVTPDGIVTSYVNGWVDPLNRIGDVGPVGTLLAYRQRGLAHSVLLECLRRMQARGMDRVCVSTGIENIPARRLYESIGFETANTTLTYVRAG